MSKAEFFADESGNVKLAIDPEMAALIAKAIAAILVRFLQR